MSVFKDGVIYLAGELLNKALPFLLMPYLTRKLGVAGFGELSYYLTILALLSIFIGLSQEGALTRYYYFYGKKAVPMIIKAGYFYNFAFSLICLLVCWFVYKSEILVFVTLIASFNSLLKVQLAIHQCQKQPKSYVLIQLINSFAIVGFTIFIMEFFSGDQVFNRILALMFGGVFTFFLTYLFINKKYKSKKEFSVRQYKLGLVYLFSFGLPLVFHQLSSFMKGQVDRIFIYKAFTPDDLGVYSAGAQIASILTILLLAINKAILPYYYEALKNKKLNIIKIKKYTLLSFLLIGFPALINLILPVQVFDWFLGSGFVGVKYYITLFLVGYGLMLPYLILVNYFFYYAKNGLISLITFSNSILYLILLIVLVNYFDVIYIPYALIISNLVLIVVLWCCLGKLQSDLLKKEVAC